MRRSAAAEASRPWCDCQTGGRRSMIGMSSLRDAPPDHRAVRRPLGAVPGPASAPPPGVLPGSPGAAPGRAHLRRTVGEMSGGPVTVRRLEAGEQVQPRGDGTAPTGAGAHPLLGVERPYVGQLGPETSSPDALSWPIVPGGMSRGHDQINPCPISYVASATPCRPGWGARTTLMSSVLPVRYN